MQQSVKKLKKREKEMSLESLKKLTLANASAAIAIAHTRIVRIAFAKSLIERKSKVYSTQTALNMLKDATHFYISSDECTRDSEYDEATELHAHILAYETLASEEQLEAILKLADDILASCTSRAHCFNMSLSVIRTASCVEEIYDEVVDEMSDELTDEENHIFFSDELVSAFKALDEYDEAFNEN